MGRPTSWRLGEQFERLNNFSTLVNTEEFYLAGKKNLGYMSTLRHPLPRPYPTHTTEGYKEERNMENLM